MLSLLFYSVSLFSFDASNSLVVTTRLAANLISSGVTATVRCSSGVCFQESNPCVRSSGMPQRTATYRLTGSEYFGASRSKCASLCQYQLRSSGGQANPATDSGRRHARRQLKSSPNSSSIAAYPRQIS